jgi:hypothetical protein
MIVTMKRNSPADVGLAAWWLLLLSPLAVSALVLRVAVYWPLSFDEASKLLVVLAVFAFLALGMGMQRQLADGWRAIRSIDKGALWMVVLAIAMTVLATCCLHRPDSDDAIYLPKLVYLLTYPSTLMDGAAHEIFGASMLPRSAAAYYPTSYEFAQAVVAHTAGVNILWIYYVLAPVAAGVLGLIALILNIRECGVSTRAAAYGGLLLVPLLLLMGEAHRSYGNISLVRLFQAKFAFMWFGLPVFVYLSRVFLRTRNPRVWLALFVVVLALSGITTSALVMLPLLAPVLLVAWRVDSDDVKGWLALATGYGFALLPTIVFALDYRRYAVAYANFGATLNAGFPQDFWGQVSLLEQGVHFPLTWILFGCALLACLCRPRRHRFLLTWTILLVLFVLNPWVATWMMQHVTSENIYWRMFYLLPLPLMLGVVIATLYESMSREHWRAYWLVLGTVVIAGLAPTSVLRPGNGLTVGAPGPSLDGLADDAKRITEQTPQGVVLAPVALAQDMAVLSARHVQIATRLDFLALVLLHQPLDDDLRQRATSFVAGQGGSLADLVPALEHFHPHTVVVAQQIVSPELISTLSQFDLHKACTINNWVVYTTN